MLSKARARARALDSIIYPPRPCPENYLDKNLDKNGIGPPWLSSLVGRGFPGNDNFALLVAAPVHHDRGLAA